MLQLFLLLVEEPLNVGADDQLFIWLHHVGAHPTGSLMQQGVHSLNLAKNPASLL